MENLNGKTSGNWLPGIFGGLGVDPPVRGYDAGKKIRVAQTPFSG
jgi:hypothetical protein